MIALAISVTWATSVRLASVPASTPTQPTTSTDGGGSVQLADPGDLAQPAQATESAADGSEGTNWNRFGFVPGPRPSDSVGGWFARGYRAEGMLLAFRQERTVAHAYQTLADAVCLKLDLDGRVLPPVPSGSDPPAVLPDYAVILSGRSVLHGGAYCSFPVRLEEHPELAAARQLLDSGVDQAAAVDDSMAQLVERAVGRQLDRLRQTLRMSDGASFRQP